MNMPNLNDYTIEQLEGINTDLMRQRAQIISNQRKVASVLESKRKEQALEKELQDIRDRHGVDVSIVE